MFVLGLFYLSSNFWSPHGISSVSLDVLSCVFVALVSKTNFRTHLHLLESAKKKKVSQETRVSCMEYRLIQDTKYRWVYSRLYKKNEGGFLV